MAKETLSIEETRDMMLAVADKIIEAEPILTDADRALGDGDHGVGTVSYTHLTLPTNREV